MTTPIPTTARFQRYRIDLDKLAQDFLFWTLDFPFSTSVEVFQNEVKNRLNRETLEEHFLGIPYRVLNDALMTICPTLTHGFEKLGKRRLALAIGIPNFPAQVPNPTHVRRVIRYWAQHWMERPYIKNKIPKDILADLFKPLEQDIQNALPKWEWNPLLAGNLLRDQSDNPLNFRAVPSLIASMLHGKTSYVNVGNDKFPITWRKVQDDDGRLGVISSPFPTSYIDKYGNSGQGYFAYKLRFELETQSGSQSPWLFMWLHAQRYVETK